MYIIIIKVAAARPNLWWSLANEYDLLPARTLEDWYAIEAYLAQNDPYGHLLSRHNCTAAYLTYYGQTCPYQADLQLPGDKTYTIQVIDIWEMTKTTVFTGVSGAVEAPLPSKEGMAVLAVRE